MTSISTSPSSSCSADSGPSAILFAGSFGKLVDRWLSITKERGRNAGTVLWSYYYDVFQFLSVAFDGGTVIFVMINKGKGVGCGDV